MTPRSQASLSVAELKVNCCGSTARPLLRGSMKAFCSTAEADVLDPESCDATKVNTDASLPAASLMAAPRGFLTMASDRMSP